jgi:hypothetical protein
MYHCRMNTIVKRKEILFLNVTETDMAISEM